MTKREVIKTVLDGNQPPYVPWSFNFTKDPKEMLQRHFETEDLIDVQKQFFNWHNDPTDQSIKPFNEGEKHLKKAIGEFERAMVKGASLFAPDKGGRQLDPKLVKKYK